MKKQTPLDREFRAFIRERDNYTCQLHKACRERHIKPPVRPCTPEDSMQVYHLIPVSVWPSGRYEERNVKLCCAGFNMFEKTHRVEMDKMHRDTWPVLMENLDLLRKVPRKTDKAALLIYFKQKRIELRERHG